MIIIKAFSSMSVYELAGHIALIIAAISTVIQISPIKVNPWSWAAKKIGKALNGEMLDRIDQLEKQIDKVEAEAAERSAKHSRAKILRFGNEVRSHQKHTKEYFDEILAEITEYDQYCNDHPDFKNKMTKNTSEIIQETYKKCMADDDFL